MASASVVTPAPQQTAVTTVPLSNDEVAAILRESGYIDSAREEFKRMKLEGFILTAGDEQYSFNPKKNEPALRARIVVPPEQYQGKWFNESSATLAGRPTIADRMCKSYYDKPDQARNYAEDGSSCRECQWNPWVKATPDGEGKCSWRGDIALQILPESGELTGDEPVWTLTLPMTSMIEYRGTRKNPNGGTVSDENFMFKLVRFGESMAAEWGVEVSTAVSMTLASYQAGGVIVDIRLPRAEAAGKSWNVIQFDPVYVEKDFADPVEPEEPAPAVKSVGAGDGTEGYDDLPF